MAVIAPDPEEKEYTFPLKDGSTFQSKIMKLKVPELKELCRQLGQPRNGLKPVLRDRLKAFSEDPDAWKHVQPGARRSHKGSRKRENVSGKPKPKKNSVAKRRETLFGDGDASTTSVVVLRSKDTRTEAEKLAVLAWADEMCEEFTDFHTPCDTDGADSLFPSTALREEKIEQKLDTLLALYTASISQAHPLALPAPPPPSLNPVSTLAPVETAVLRQRAAFSCSEALVAQSSAVPTVSCTSGLLQAFAVAAQSGPPATALTVALPSSRSSPPTLSVPTDSTPLAAPTGSLKVIKLADGTCIEFYASEVPDPIFVSFAEDIPKLARMWDDRKPGYRAEECLLKIKGHGIPLRLWETAYKYSGLGDNRWKGTKHKWGMWKFVAEAYNDMGEEAFWAKFCDTKTDRRMSFAAIGIQLREERKARDACLASQVRDQLGDAFREQYGYKGKQLTRSSAIAKRSRTLES